MGALGEPPLSTEGIPPLGAWVRAKHLRLTSETYSLTSPADPRYNCIAYGIEDTEHRFQPGGYPGTTWPEGVDQSDSVRAWREFYEHHGFNVCPAAGYEDGFITIAIYATEGEGKHVARALPNGRWASKLGELQDIEHTLDSLEDANYGQVELFMRKPKPATG